MTDARIETLRALQSPCRLCPRECRALRADGEVGFCGVADTALVASFGPHFGEESCLVGQGGSGTIFLASCNLKCVFCQNYDISQAPAGELVSPAQLASVMLSLASRGCANVNFVTPTHFAPQIAEAILAARARGLRVPVVYNCGGYESSDALRALEGLVDIYMPDAKFLDPSASERFLNAADYPERMRAALAEMHRQVGDLVVEDGLAARGLLVRHLVMPGFVDDSKRVIDFLAELSPRTFVNVMAQYRPCYSASSFPQINRRPSPSEVSAVRSYALSKLLRLDA
jgi:putative pyruvate formate lyase activating enzyme